MDSLAHKPLVSVEDGKLGMYTHEVAFFSCLHIFSQDVTWHGMGNRRKKRQWRLGENLAEQAPSLPGPRNHMKTVQILEMLHTTTIH